MMNGAIQKVPQLYLEFFSKWKGNFFKKEEEKSREFIDFKEQLTFLVILRVNYIKSIKSIWCSWLCFFFFLPLPVYHVPSWNSSQTPSICTPFLFLRMMKEELNGSWKQKVSVRLYIPWKHISSTNASPPLYSNFFFFSRVFVPHTCNPIAAIRPCSPPWGSRLRPLPIDGWRDFF